MVQARGIRKKWKQVREIKELLTLNVSRHGTGLYLYLPKDLVEQYDINTGDRVKLHLRALFKRDGQGEGNASSRT